MNTQIPIIYYDVNTMPIDSLYRITQGIKGFFGNCIALPKEVDLTFMDKETLIQQLKETIQMLEETEEEKENNE